MSGSDRDRTADRSAFFNKLAGNWSQAHYGPQGGMVSRIGRFVDAPGSTLFTDSTFRPLTVGINILAKF